ncbi:MAG: hypothetical protein B7C24_06330 [Bacteroidetes bacterium 4572_77]|nr:MAG: hypothetical protein B7C24_06330 [Bacteroidetes bacterium 4572_77]
MPKIEIVLSMALYHQRLVKRNTITVIVNVLRATTSIVAALDYGVRSIIPVSSSAEAEAIKEVGYLLAADQKGKLLDIADIAASASDFWNDRLKGKEIIYLSASTTKALRLSREESKAVVLGSFANLSSLANYLHQQGKNINIICTGYKDLPALEDQLLAGALCEKLIEKGKYKLDNDTVIASIDLWKIAQPKMLDYQKKLDYHKRFPIPLSGEVLKYTFTPDSTKLIPMLHFNHITALR